MNPDDQTNTVPTVPADDNGQVSDTPVSQQQDSTQDIPVDPMAPVEPVAPTEPAAPVMPTGETPVAPIAGEASQQEEVTA